MPAAQRGGRGRAAPAPNRLHDALADFGDSELVLAGLHENFHRARFLDTHFRRAAGVLDTLGWTDVLARGVHRRGDFALLKYLPAAALGIHAVVAAPERCGDTPTQRSQNRHMHRQRHCALLGPPRRLCAAQGPAGGRARHPRRRGRA